MKKIVSLHINTERPAELAKFYGDVLEASAAWQFEGITGFVVDDFRLEIAGHDEVSGPNQTPARHFFDLMVDDVRAEFERIVGVGAAVIQEPYDFSDDDMAMTIATLADPDGNYFQLVSMDNAGDGSGRNDI